jgi:putative ABC transport system permease protein
LPPLKYPAPETFFYLGTDTTVRFFAEATRRIAKLPAVQASAATSNLPLSGSNSDSSFAIEGREGQSGPGPDEEIRTITPDYFRVLRTPLLQGRFFNDSDTAESTRVVIVNRTFARKYFANGDAVGKRITFDDPKHDPKWVTIVGIVGDIRHRGLDVDPQPEYYRPHTQFPERSMILAVRSTQDPRSLASAIRREIQSIDPDQPIANIRTLEAVTADSVAPRRMSMALLVAFAGIALLLAGVGIYGVISYLVVQRTHEIGVRMALGAQRSDVLRLILGRSLKLVSAGAAIGLIIALMSAHTLRALLYSVSAFDAPTFAVVTILLGAVALVASYLPAMRATRADPTIALGHNT